MEKRNWNMKMLLKKEREQRNKEWQALSHAARNVLEWCWMSLSSDKPTSKTFQIGEPTYGGKHILTEDVIKEILEHQKTNLKFNLKVFKKEIVISGAYRELEWEKFEYALTENGAKELEEGDYLYKSTSEDVGIYEKLKILKETNLHYVVDDWYLTKVPKKSIRDHQSVTVKKDEFLNYFFQRETEEIKKRYERQQLELEFESIFSLPALTNEQIQKMIDIIGLENE